MCMRYTKNASIDCIRVQTGKKVFVCCPYHIWLLFLLSLAMSSFFTLNAIPCHLSHSFSIVCHKHKLHFRHFTLDRLQLYNISEWNLYLLFHSLHITGCIPLPFISRRRSKNEQTYLVVNLIEIVINVDFKKMLPFHLY